MSYCLTLRQERHRLMKKKLKIYSLNPYEEMNLNSNDETMMTLIKHWSILLKKVIEFPFKTLWWERRINRIICFKLSSA